MKPREFSLVDRLAFSTVRLVSLLPDGKETVGTGFFVDLCPDTRHVPVLVTNKHVIEGHQSITCMVTLAGEDNRPVYGRRGTFEFCRDVTKWTDHPDAEVDLCAIPIANLFNRMFDEGHRFYFHVIPRSHFVSDGELGNLSALEAVAMIGYPTGLWDDVNNMPIFRRGVTATHPRLDYQGRQEFLIDAACFPGSSGSPVFWHRDEYWLVDIDRPSPTRMNYPPLKLLGVLYAGPQYFAPGELRMAALPSVESEIPMNLGVVIKARRILEFWDIFNPETARGTQTST